MFYVDWFNTGTWGNPGWLIPVDYLTGENPFFLKEKLNFVAQSLVCHIKIELI